jgi:translation initiation factor IF-3
MRIQDALDFANARDLDLVQFGVSADSMPTCRVLSYSTFKYKEEKKRKLENQNKPVLKEIQLRPSISPHDLQIKTKQLNEFLSKGYTVRMRIKLKGREKANSIQHGLFFSQLVQSFSGQARVEGKYMPDGVPVGGVLTLKPIKHQ